MSEDPKTNDSTEIPSEETRHLMTSIVAAGLLVVAPPQSAGSIAYPSDPEERRTWRADQLVIIRASAIVEEIVDQLADGRIIDHPGDERGAS